MAADPIPASLSDLRVTESEVTGSLVLRAGEAVTIDDSSVKATVGGVDAPVVVTPAQQQPRSAMIVIDTSGSMGRTGMGTARAAVGEFVAGVPDDVKVGVVSFANTAGVDVAPTTDHDKVTAAVGSLTSGGYTALYQAIQVAVNALGTEGERSIILLSDGGDTVEKDKGGAAQAEKQRKAAITALTASKVRAEAIAFKSDEANVDVLSDFAAAGGGTVANAEDRAAVSGAFAAAARALESQAGLTITRPSGVTGTADVVVTGTADARPFSATSAVNLGDIAPLPTPSDTPVPLDASGSPTTSNDVSITSGWLWPSVGLLVLGLFLVVLVMSPSVFRSERRERVLAIERYAIFRPGSRRASDEVSASALSRQLVDMGDRVMEGRESTSRTMGLIDRADLPWRAGEWFLFRIMAVIVGGAVGLLLLASRAPWLGVAVGVALGFLVPGIVLRYLARRRARAFERTLPDVLMLVATSLGSGFSLLQSLDAVAKDAAEPCAKEFSRALAETRIGADVSDALDHTAVRMDSHNMRWTTMAIRIQREVGGNLAETLRITAATLRERESLKRQMRTLSAEGRLSAYILIGLPILLFIYMTLVNYDYVSLLWTTFLGILMSFGAVVAMIIGIFWMRKVVEIEV